MSKWDDATSKDILSEFRNMFEEMKKREVEHEETIMRSADWLVDLGPGAGINGGFVVYSGAPAGISLSLIQASRVSCRASS